MSRRFIPIVSIASFLLVGTLAPAQTQTAPTVRQVDPAYTQPVSPASRDGAVDQLGAPAAADQPLERVEPRPPLSDMYSPPSRTSEAKPVKGQEQWRITRLFNPVASAAGRLEVKGHKIALTGIEPVALDEKCSWNGTEWPCGTVARTAFRQWLRSRAVQCKVPDTALAEEIRADCYIGRSDMSDWLISNGWARPESGGPYEEAGSRAKDKRVGIYGAPPRRISIIVVPQPSIEPGDTTLLDADPLESTPDELAQEPEPGFTPPTPTDPSAVFPPPPPPAEPTP